MDHARAFLQDIIEHPEEDAPRLIFADWLEEQGQPDRAEFIRLQVRLARLGVEDPSRPELEDRASALLAEREEEWAGPLRGLALDWRFRRGFVEQVALPGQAFLDHAGPLFDAFPLRAAHLLLQPNQMQELAACPHLARLEGLGFRPPNWSRHTLYDLAHSWFEDRDFYLSKRTGPPNIHGLGDQALRTLLESPHLGRLTTLDFAGNGLEGPAIQALVQSRWLPQLVRLDFSYNPALGDRSARLLSSAAGASNLELLRLQETNLTPGGIQALFHSRCLPRLRTLDVPAGRLFRPDHDPGPILSGLLAAPVLTQLTGLDFSFVQQGRQAAQAFAQVLAGAPVLAGLRTLRLSHLPLGPEGARKLAGSPHLAGLTALELRGCALGPEGLQALADSPHLAHLTALLLADNRVRDRGVKALASSPYLTRLTRLDLYKNDVGGPGIQALAASPNLAGLRFLILSSNFVGPASTQALAGSPHLGRLTHLDLGLNRLEADGARALARADNLTRLELLSLWGSSVGNEGAQALAASPNLARLTELRLDANGLERPGILALAASPHLRRLRALGVSSNRLGDEERTLLQERFGDRVWY